MLRMSKIVRLALVVVVLGALFSFFGKIGSTVFTSRAALKPAPAQVAQAVTVQQAPATAVGAVTAIQQVPAVPIAPVSTALQPLTDVALDKLQKGAAQLEIYNVAHNSGDSLPAYPAVYTGKWKNGMESNKYTGKIAAGGKTIFDKATLSRWTFYVDSPGGDYIFAAQAERQDNGGGEGHADLSVRINDTNVIPQIIGGFSNSPGTGSGNIKLEKGLYKVDIRLFQQAYSPQEPITAAKFSVQMKSPTSGSASVISTASMFTEKG